MGIRPRQALRASVMAKTLEKRGASPWGQHRTRSISGGTVTISALGDMQLARSGRALLRIRC